MEGKPLGKSAQLGLLKDRLGEVGYVLLTNSSDPSKGLYWFCRAESSDGTKACIRVVRKEGFKIFTIHVGWHNNYVRQFVLDLMTQYWHSGLQWLTESSVIDEPCFVIFNLGGYLGWPLAGISYDCPQQEFCRQVSDLTSRAIEPLVTPIANTEKLLSCYLGDTKPFRWVSSNTAIRIAETAALAKMVHIDPSELKRCSEEFITLINADMFGLGSGDAWCRAVLASI